MEKIRWNDDLSVGVDLIDGQHRKWIDYYNGAAEALHSMQGPTGIASTLGFLIDYTEEHFATEEKYMKKHDYPGFQDHAAIHNELRRTLSDLVQDYEEDGATNPLAGSIDTFLGNWLVKYINDVDMKFALFLKENGIELSD